MRWHPGLEGAVVFLPLDLVNDAHDHCADRTDRLEVE
jgi:hypothetical protein